MTTFDYMENQKVKIQVYVDPDTKKTISKIAEKEKRSESNVVNILILEAIIRRDNPKFNP
jgi:hypothetical protein